MIHIVPRLVQLPLVKDHYAKSAHDTQKTLVGFRTMEGLKAVCKYLLTTSNFKYVILHNCKVTGLRGSLESINSLLVQIIS